MNVVLPPVRPFRQFAARANAWSDHYGSLQTAAAYCGLELPEHYTIKGIWHHGCFGPWVARTPRVLTLNVPGAEQRMVWVARGEQAELLRTHGYADVRALGLPILYTPPSGVYRKPRSLLVMPGHSLVGWKAPDRTQYERYADDILKIAGEFEHVTVCISPKCEENGFWVKEFSERGINIVSGAACSDANALIRIRMLCEQFETVTTNGWGSHVAYALAFGAKLSIYGTFPSVDEASLLVDTTWRSDPNALRTLLSAEVEQEKESFLRAFYVPPKAAVENRELGNWLIGGEHRLTPNEMRELLPAMVQPLPPKAPRPVPPSAEKGKHLVFVAHGPGQVNGPNIWLTRLLPALKQRGFSPRVLMFMTRQGGCPIAEKLRAAGVPCDTLPYAYTEDMTRTITTYAEQHACDVFVPNLNIAGYFASNILKAAGIPTVGVMHSDDDFYRDLADEFIRQQGGRHLSAAVTVSDYQFDALRALEHGSTKVVKAPCGAPMPASVAKFSSRPFRFVYVGRLVEEQKRISDTVRAVLHVLRRHANAEFHLCGDGSARPAVQALIRDSGVAGRIKLWGNVASEEVQKVLLQSQAFVLLSDYEGIPIALMEAMACGVVPICTKIRSGVGDIVRDGESGLTVADRDSAFVAAAEKLLLAPEFWARCSAGARAMVEKNFSVQSNADAWASLLSKLIGEAGPRRALEVPATIELPPVRSNPKGMAREDYRRPKVAASTPAFASTVGDLPLVLVRSHEYNYSETFVEDHVNHLTKNLTLLYGYPFPRFVKGGRSVVSAACEQKIQALTAHGGTLTAELWNEYSRELAAFLQSSGAQAALVESGLMGSFVHEACEQAGMPYVVHFHGIDAFGEELLAKWKHRYEKFFAKAASLVVVSKAMHRQVLKLGAPAGRTLLGPYGVAVKLPRLADPAKADPRFVAVGRFVAKKAPQITLQAFAHVHRQVPAARLVMIGDGPLLASCRQWVQENGLAAAVTFAGVQSRDEVSRHMAASRIFVQHSITADNGDSEGLPLAVLEAGAHGLPVVSTRHAGIPDAVREGLDGLLVDEKDTEGMAAAMLRLAQDAELAAQLGKSFRERVGKKYSRTVSLKRLYAILEAAAKGRPALELGEPLAEPENVSAGDGGRSDDGRYPHDAVANDRNPPAAYLDLGRVLADEGDLARAYCAIGEAHRLTGGTLETRDLLDALEAYGVLADPLVENYRRRAGWLPRPKRARPRRVLVVTNLLPPQEMGGFGRTMWEFSHELVARGNAVLVLTADMPHLLRKPSAEHAAFEPNVRRVLRLLADWKDEGPVAETDPERRRASIRANRDTIIAAVKEFGPDAVMVGNLDFVGHHFLQELLDQGIPVLHRLGNEKPGYKADSAPRSPLYWIAGGSEWVNEKIRASGYPVERFAVLPPGSPLTEYYRAFPPQREKLRIAFAGVLRPYKGAHVLVDALLHVHRQGIDFECTLGGDTPSPEYIEKLRAFAATHGFAERVHFPGFLSKPELAALYARSNVLVFPSLVDEVFGKTQVEAMAAGLFVISSGNGGAREVVRDGVTGLIFKSDDARDLAMKLIQVHRQPKLAAKVAAAGQADAFRFDTAASVDRLEELLTEIVAAARRQSPEPALCHA